MLKNSQQPVLPKSTHQLPKEQSADADVSTSSINAIGPQEEDRADTIQHRVQQSSQALKPQVPKVPAVLTFTQQQSMRSDSECNVHAGSLRECAATVASYARRCSAAKYMHPTSQTDCHGNKVCTSHQPSQHMRKQQNSICKPSRYTRPLHARQQSHMSASTTYYSKANDSQCSSHVKARFVSPYCQWQLSLHNCNYKHRNISHTQTVLNTCSVARHCLSNAAWQRNHPRKDITHAGTLHALGCADAQTHALSRVQLPHSNSIYCTERDCTELLLDV
jgi:hypothetical protein